MKLSGLLNKRKEGGFTLFELLLVLAIIASLSALATRDAIVKTQRTKAVVAGKDLKAFTTAVRRAIAADGAVIAGGPGATQTYNGFDWLQSAATCGGAAAAAGEYLLCAFRGVEPFRLNFVTTVTNNIATGETTAVVRFDDDDGSVTVGSIDFDGTNRRDLANIVASSARSSDIFQASATGAAGYDVYEVDADGIILANVSLTPDLDIYLRRDGGNSPTNTIDFDNQSLVGVDQLTATDGDFDDLQAVNDIISTLGEMQAQDYLITGKTVNGGDRVWASESVDEVLLLRTNDLVDKPVCPGGGVPQIYAYPVIFSQDVTAEVIGAVQAWAVNDSATQWRVRVRILLPSGWTSSTIPSDYRRVVATTKCSRL